MTEILKIVGNISDNDFLLLGIAVLIFASASAIKILKFDLSDYLNKRAERKKESARLQAQMSCPHVLMEFHQDMQLICTPLFRSAPRDSRWQCGRCGLILRSEMMVYDQIKAFYPFAIDSFDGDRVLTATVEYEQLMSLAKRYGKQMKAFERHARNANK